MKLVLFYVFMWANPLNYECNTAAVHLYEELSIRIFKHMVHCEHCWKEWTPMVWFIIIICHVLQQHASYVFLIVIEQIEPSVKQDASTFGCVIFSWMYGFIVTRSVHQSIINSCSLMLQNMKFRLSTCLRAISNNFIKTPSVIIMHVPFKNTVKSRSNPCIYQTCRQRDTKHGPLQETGSISLWIAFKQLFVEESQNQIFSWLNLKLLFNSTFFFLFVRLLIPIEVIIFTPFQNPGQV